MNTNFIYDIPTKVYFGENQLSHLGEELKKYGKRVLLTYGGGSIKKNGLYDKAISEIQKAGLTLFEFGGIEPNPRHTSINAAAEICKKEKIDVLLAVGGGSTIDATKAIGVASYYDGDSWDLVTQKAPITDCLPIITILTLAATGSEMNGTAVISNLETNDKKGIKSSNMLPKVSFLDPTNTYMVSAYQTACGAADILSHLFEIYFNQKEEMYMLDSISESLMKTVLKYAPVALKEPTNYEARANLMWASSWALNGFVRCGKTQEWSCHAMEHQLSAYYDITHGLGLAILTPRWMEYVLDETTVSKFYQFGTNVFGIDKNLSKMEVAQKGIEMLSDFLFNQLGLNRTLSEINIDNSNFKIMTQKACKGDVIQGFKPLRVEDIEKIYEMCL